MYPLNKLEIDLAEKQLMDEFLWLTENQPRWKYRSLATLNRRSVCTTWGGTRFRVERITYGIFDKRGELIRTVAWPERRVLGPSYHKAGVSLAARLYRC